MYCPYGPDPKKYLDPTQTWTKYLAPTYYGVMGGLPHEPAEHVVGRVDVPYTVGTPSHGAGSAHGCEPFQDTTGSAHRSPAGWSNCRDVTMCTSNTLM